MDQNGLSDPFVHIELKPSYIFSKIEKQTTCIIKNNLNPVFNDIFEFKVSEKLCLQPGNVLQFSVMDHDLFLADDFEGEAFIELSTIPGLKRECDEGSYKDLKYLEIFLIQPKEHPSKIIDVFEYRKARDKLAAEFLESRRDRLD